MNKRNLLAIAAMLLLLAALASGCTKTNSSVFSWSYQGFNYVADSAYSPATASPNTFIDAFSQLTLLYMYSSTRLAVGTYHLGGTNTSAWLEYIAVGPLYSTSGTLNVTYNDGKKMSGNFGTTLTDQSYISGSFSDVPIR